MVLSRAWSDRDRKTVRLIRQLFSYMREKGVDADPKDFAARWIKNGTTQSS